MKKIIIGIIAIAVAVVANAATCSWTCSNVQNSDGKLTSGHLYLFFATSSDSANSNIAAIQALAGTGLSSFETTLASANWNDTKKATAAGNFSIGTSAALGSYTLPSNSSLGLSGNTAYYAYAVIFDTDTVSDESNYIITSPVSITTFDDSSSMNKQIALGSQSSNTSWMAVGSVPEPTSGLLMLLGVAGLALKRKRA